jgi:magnesium chelatase family protein
MLASVHSATLLGATGQPVIVEVHVSGGLPGLTIVGLPDDACRESRDRVRAAIVSSGLTWPMQRITVNLAPSSVRKGGAGLDLPIALGVLAAAGTIPAESVVGVAAVGELGLDGALRRVTSIVPIAASVPGEVLVVPADCVVEAELVHRGTVRGAATLTQIVEALGGDAPWPQPRPPVREAAACVAPPDLADVRGHPLGRLAVEVAAAGGHHLLFVGPPGAGKTMLSSRLAPLLPDLDRDAALEVTTVHSAAGVPLPASGLVERPPFRAPHHGASMPALIGGGSAQLRPGEVSLATQGVLFLDELAEFHTNVLDALRQPMEEHVVRISRARGAAEFPAAFLLVAAMNPCPCGRGGPPGSCACSELARARYVRRVSGPLLDRFDLRVELGPPATADLFEPATGEASGPVARRVAAVRALARARGVPANGDLPVGRLDELAPLQPSARRLLHALVDRGSCSARGTHRLRRVARTVSDLRGEVDRIDDESVAVAVQLRSSLSATFDRAVA